VSAHEALRELAPLAAVDALDGEDALEFAAHVRACAECRREVDAFAAVAARTLGRAVSPAALPSALRQRVLLGSGASAGGGSAPHGRAGWRLAAAAAVALGLGAALVAADRRLSAAREQVRRLEGQAAGQAALQDMLGDARTQVVALAAQAAAPGAGGRVLANPETRRAVLLASGLGRAPEGKTYEVWVIAGGAPVPSGLFEVDAQGRAVAELPWLEQTAAVKTFAVTLEPAGGTAAPTGPMVLAGSTS
jgi:anti-sigma-K factor RskA